MGPVKFTPYDRHVFRQQMTEKQFLLYWAVTPEFFLNYAGSLMHSCLIVAVTVVTYLLLDGEQSI